MVFSAITEFAAQEPKLYAFIIGLVGAAILASVINVAAMAVVWLERKVMGDLQARYGPNRVGGRWGILQLGADAIKLFTKEDIIPRGADRPVYVWAPIVASATTMLVAAAIPFGAVNIGGREIPLVVANMDISAFYVEAVLSIMAIAAFMAGWSSNNKYSMVGAFRGVARMISYEVPMGICVISVAIMAHSLNLVEIVQSQTIWYAVAQPLGFVIFTIALITDLGRMPFDQSEGEEEIVAGYVTEYGGIRFGLLYFQEYNSMLLGSILLVLLYLGGWNGPTIPVISFISPMVWFLMKVLIVLVSLIWIRVSLVRFRIDQVTDLGWKWMLPLSMVNLAWAVAVGLYFA